MLNLDDVSIGHSGSTTRYNYEPDRLLRLSITAPKTVNKAAQFTVSGFFPRGNRAVIGEPVELQAKPAGARQWIDAEGLILGRLAVIIATLNGVWPEWVKYFANKADHGFTFVGMGLGAVVLFFIVGLILGKSAARS